MKKIGRYWLSAGTGCVFLSCMLGAGIASASGFEESIQQWESSIPSGPHWGSIVYDLTAKKNRLSVHAQGDFVPASTMKLVTATSAIGLLGPGFSFSTDIGYKGQIKNGVLLGDVWLSLGGDPTLKTADLLDLIQALNNKGIQEVKGRFHVVTRMATAVPYAPGWMWDELSYEYAVPFAPVIINRNRFVLSLTPKKGHPYASIHATAPKGVVRISNHLKLTKKYNKWCPLSIYSTGGNDYTVRGCLSRSWGKQNRVLAIRNSWSNFKVILKKGLKQSHISVKKIVLQSHIKKNVHWLSKHHSAQLPKLLKTMLKDSDNLIADALFLEMGKGGRYPGGVWQQSAQAEQDFLKKTVGIHTENLNLVDGSGLSRYDLIRPENLYQLLQFINKHRSYRKIVYNGLPILGKDGTLAYRFHGKKEMAGVRAKTGSMSGVSALAGYIKANNGHRYILVSMMNGSVHKIRAWRLIEDQLLKIIVKKQV